MRWYLIGKAPHATVVSGAVIVGKTAGLIVIVLETGLYHDHNCLLPSTFRLLFHHTHLVLQKKWKVRSSLIKQPPVNPLENEMVLAAGKAPQATVVSTAVIVGKAAGLIVIVLETELSHDHNCLLQSTFRLLFHHAFGFRKKEGFEVPLINSHLLIH
jgi:hypothetical protein